MSGNQRKRNTQQQIRVYSRPGCHLCEQLIEEMLPLIRDHLALEVVNIDNSPLWREEYGTRIPVVEYDGRIICQYSLDKAQIQEIITRLASS